MRPYTTFAASKYWKRPDNRDTTRVMDTLNPAPNQGNVRKETGSARRRRLAWEAERIAEARAELDAGMYVDSADVDAWIDSVGTDHELPLPSTGRR
jgi:hypothetical protein